MRREPGLTYQAFCVACRTRIATCLSELPSAYERLCAEIGERGTRGAFRTPFGPSLPLRADVDALKRLIAESLVSWEERVRDVAALSVLDTAASRHRRETVVIEQAAGILAAHLDALLALAAEPMRRTVPRDGTYVAATLDLDGGSAGNEILDLHYRARRIVGETKAQPETLDGIPCRECEEFTLERAEPPSDPSIPSKHSRCTVCGDEMALEEYEHWVRLYEAWTRGGDVLICRRCELGRCADCAWISCGCRAPGHAAA